MEQLNLPNDKFSLFFFLLINPRSCLLAEIELSVCISKSQRIIIIIIIIIIP